VVAGPNIAERTDAVDRAGITAFRCATPLQPARQLILAVRHQQGSVHHRERSQNSMTSLLARAKSLFVRNQRGARTPKPHRFYKPAVEVLEDRSLLSQTVTFSTSAPGVSAAIPYWGLDTRWPSSDNMRRGLIFMGSENVNVVDMPATLDAPLVGGDISAADKARLQQSINLAAMAGPNAMWNLSGGQPVDPWYRSGTNRVYPDRWAAAMEAAQRYYNRPMGMAEPFNEPDYLPWNEGSRQDLSNIMGLLGASPGFAGTLLAGGSTITTDDAASWYDALGGHAAVGTTHALYGSVANYVGFIQHVAVTGGIPFNPEVHNLAEAIIGANYGLQGAIWWGTAERARGDFVQASQGRELGYAADWPNWSAAAVYRAPNGTVQAFLGCGERIGQPTTYTLHSTDRDVYFDGHGPMRDYTVTIGTNQERVINITWGGDVQPVIGGRYAIINANSGLAMEVRNASTNNGAILQQNNFTGASHQLWDISPLPGQDLDVSYFHMQNVNSAKYADLLGYSYADGATIGQWNAPGNPVENWYFDYAGNGNFYIRSRWSNKCLAVSGGAGAPIVQETWAGTPDQLWQLVPAGGMLLPSGWADTDVGSPGLPGAADYSITSGTWSVAGGGSDIWNTSDQFHFASEHLASDGSIVAHVTSVQNTDPWAKAGVMFRDSADPSAVFADVMATPGNGVTFQWRATAGAVPSFVNLPGITAPVWVELTRVGNSFSAFYSGDGNSWTQLGTAQTFNMNTVAQAGLAVTAHNNGLLNTSTFSNVAVLPGGWTAGDIGGPGLPGSSSYDANSGTWAVEGGGADIWNTADQFRFTYQSFTGDGSLTARVTGITNTDPWAKAGVMFRDSADPRAVFADVMATPGNGVTFQWRDTYGVLPHFVNVTGITAPVWVQLVRASDTFSAYYSTDDVSWVQIGDTQTIVMSPTAQVGLAVTAHNNAVLNTATFDNVSLSAPGGSAGAGGSGSPDLPSAAVLFNHGGAARVRSQLLSLLAGQLGAPSLVAAVNGRAPDQIAPAQSADGTGDTFARDVKAANCLYLYSLGLKKQKTVSGATPPADDGVMFWALDWER
jgi:hypothetical protein